MLERPYLVRTPESVEFTFREAGVVTRLLAWSVDAILMTALLLGGMLLLSQLTSITLGLAQPLVYIFSFLVTSGYFVFCEWRMGGQSPGKRALGLCVLGTDGLKITLSQSLFRNLLRLVDSMPLLYSTALVIATFSERQQRLGDHVARTLVVVVPRPVAPKALGAAETSPLSREPGFREAVRRRTTVEERDLALAAVLRREQLRTAARIRVFAALSDRFQRRLAIEKPAHLSDERFLCDVAAALTD